MRQAALAAPAPAGARHAPARPRVATAASTWPRLLAHRHAAGLELALEHSDRRRTHLRTLPAGSGATLTDAVRRYLDATGQPVTVGALVVDGGVSAGRVQLDPAAPSLGIEALRHALGLESLQVLDEFTALRHGAGIPDGDALRWIVPPARPALAAPTVLCRLGTGHGPATLAGIGPDAPAPHAALMRYPASAHDEDAHQVTAFLRSRGQPPLFGLLLSAAGLERAFEALAGLDDDWPGPLPAATIVSLATGDEAARRACAVVCDAIAQVCALLALDGTRRVLLAGPLAPLLEPALRRHSVAARVAGLRESGGHAGEPIALGVLAEPIRYLDGARNALAQALCERRRATGETIAERVRALYGQLTPTQRRVADLVLSDLALATREPISVIARAAGVSQPQVVRFCRALGFDGLADFRLGLVASLARSAGAS